MPKNIKKQKLTEKINKLEEELKHLDNEINFDGDKKQGSRKSGKYSRHFDADRFDIDKEPGSSKRGKDERGNWPKKPDVRSKDHKFNFSYRGRGRGLDSRGRGTESRGRGIERGRLRGRGRGTFFRGSFNSPFRSKDRFKSPETSKSKPQDLYNDDEDWSRYVSKNLDQEKSKKDDIKDSEHKFSDRKRSPSREDHKGRSGEAGDKKENKDQQDERDMFFFPSEKHEEKVALEANIESKTTNSQPDVMDLFQELQAKLASTGSNISGIDIIADTLKKLGQIQSQTQGIPPQNQQNMESTNPTDAESKPSSSTKKTAGVSFSISSTTKLVKSVDNQNIVGDDFAELEVDSKEGAKYSKEKPFDKNDKEKLTIKEKLNDEVEPRQESLSSNRTVGERKDSRHESPHHRRGGSPGYRKERSDYHRRDSPSSPRHKDTSPSRRRNSPSPPYRRRRTPSPVYRRRRDSNSPHRHRDSVSPFRRRGSRTPPRYRDLHSPSRKRRDNDWYSRRSPKRRRSRSRSRSPRADYRRRSRSLSPGRYDSYRRRGQSPVTFSPERRNTLPHQPLETTWYNEKSRTFTPSDPLQQPVPPGGESSDVYAEARVIPPMPAPIVQEPPGAAPPLQYQVAPTEVPTQMWKNYIQPPPSHYYPPYQQTTDVSQAPPSLMMNPPPALPDTMAHHIASQGIPNIPPPIGTHIAARVPDNMEYQDPGGWTDSSQLAQRQPNVPTVDPEEARRKAVEEEKKQQRLTLLKQRREYVKKRESLKTDLEQLVKQKKELLAEKRVDNEPFITKNTKLQAEVQNKLKAVANVIDMLTGIMGEEKIEDDDEEDEVMKETPQSHVLESAKPTQQLPSSSIPNKVISLDSPPSQTMPSTVTNPPPPGDDTPSSQIPNWWLTQDQRPVIPKPHEKLPKLGVLDPVQSLNSPVTPTLVQTPPPKLQPPPLPPQFQINLELPPIKARTQTPPTDSIAQPTVEISATTPASANTKSLEPTPDPSVEERFNIVHYDPELHWCRVCNAFPRTAKEFLNHLHAPDHKQLLSDRKLVDMPWHNNQVVEEVKSYKDAPTKRVPIKGLQFFISATAWYCKLCDTWIGDLHCASVHLKSSLHAKKYAAFTETNPHWENEWLVRRSHAFDQTADDRSRLEAKNQQQPSEIGNSPSSSKADKSKLVKTASEQLISALSSSHSKHSKDIVKKKKKSRSSSSSSSTSSSSSSSSSSSDNKVSKSSKKESVRVAIRKSEKRKSVASPIIPVEVPKIPSKWDSPERVVRGDTDSTGLNKNTSSSDNDDKLLKEWLEIANSQNPDQQLLNQLTDKLKLKQQIDRSIEKIKENEKQKLLLLEKLKNRQLGDAHLNSLLKDEIKKQNDILEEKLRNRYDSHPSKTRRTEDGSGRRSDRRKDSSSSSRSHEGSNIGKRDNRSGSNRSSDRVVKQDKRSKRYDHHEAESSNSKTDKSKKTNPDKDDTKLKSTDIETRSSKEDTNQCTGKETQKTMHKQLYIPSKSILDSGESSSENEEVNQKSSKAFPDSTLIKKEPKKTISINVSKSKLPFIGKMPFVGKGNTVKKEEDADSKLVWPNIPEVEVKVENKLSEESCEKSISSKEETQPKSEPIKKTKTTQSKETKTGEVIKPISTESINTISLSKTPSLVQRIQKAKDLVASWESNKAPYMEPNKGPEDMDIDDDDKPEESLPEDFQTALHILFPSEKPGSDIIVEEVPLPAESPSNNKVQLSDNVLTASQSTLTSAAKPSLLSNQMNANMAQQPALNEPMANVPVGNYNTPFNKPVIENQHIPTGNVSRPIIDHGPRGPGPILNHGPRGPSPAMEFGPRGLVPMMECGPRGHTPIMGPGSSVPGPMMERGPGPMMDRGPGPMMDRGPGPMMGHGPGPMMDCGPRGPAPMMGSGPRGPGPMMDRGPGPMMDRGPGLMMDRGPGPMMDRGPGPMMDRGPGPMMDRGPGPMMGHGPGPMMDCGPRGPAPMMSLGPRAPGPMMDHGPGPMMDRGPGSMMDRGPGPMMDRGPGPRMMDCGPRGPMMEHGPRGPGPMMGHGPRGPGPMGPRPPRQMGPGPGPMGPGPGPMGPGPGPMRLPGPPGPPTPLEADQLKKKNPLSQKKRRKLQRLRDEILENQLKVVEERVAEKIKQKQTQLDEMAMLGIEEDDLAAQ